MQSNEDLRMLFAEDTQIVRDFLLYHLLHLLVPTDSTNYDPNEWSYRQGQTLRQRADSRAQRTADTTSSL